MHHTFLHWFLLLLLVRVVLIRLLRIGGEVALTPEVTASSTVIRSQTQTVTHTNTDTDIPRNTHSHIHRHTARKRLTHTHTD